MLTTKGRDAKEYYMLSTDGDKPTKDVANGSVLLEMDTGDVYVFDKENSAWQKL